ncbi:MAG: hypothetical protein U0984_07200, partial [Prosthecobacter sp.]|nr:hypothetical protein [Prosthecobacter sp.]
MFHPRLLILLAACVQVVTLASQPKSLADLPDAHPEAEQAGFVVPDGVEVTLFASDPLLQKPVQMNWDAQ